MFKYYRVSFFLKFLVGLVLLLFLREGLLIFSSMFVVCTDYLLFDSISFYLIILVLFLGIYSQMSFLSCLSRRVQFFLFLSLFFSVRCFFINHSIFFWCFYELSMLPLLYLIFKESPYSERFLAGWYFACYLLITSLPLILVLIYLSVIKGSYLFTDWSIGNARVRILILLSFIFFTKVPLVPFHTWLPIVHAEATRIVSIYLSGYIMKLGLLGVFRCSYYIFDFNLKFYLFICFVMAVFFFVTSSGELDGKRWLAFLSLSHIIIPFFGFFIRDWSSINYSFFYCLGHGLSAGLVFGLLWFYYDLSNSRNWLLLKSGVNKKTSMLLIIICLLSLCSFPTTIQFFCEVGLIKISFNWWIYLLFWCLYLFLGGLVPLTLCGHLLIRSEWREKFNVDNFSFFKFLVFLCFWCYLGLLFI